MGFVAAWENKMMFGHAPLLAGTQDPTTQAALFAAADHSLIGEDVYAGGAYIGRDAAHVASLRAQDVMRVALVVIIVLGALGKTFGLF